MKQWSVRKTLLLVGEGLHDKAFLTHVKHLFAPRGCGLVVTVKNAHGKGALNVVNCAIRHRSSADYDRCAVMLDTDTDYDDRVIGLAAKNGIRIIASDPCIEALLLRVLGKKPGSPKKLKSQLARFVQDDPTSSQNYAVHFGEKRLKEAATSEEAIKDLLGLFDIAVWGKRV